jgi:hypoxanthine phosphoribosyltransferase
VTDLADRAAPDVPRFAHESEGRFARILDFYGVPWEYEPVEFVLQWDEGGRPAAGFRPDFWLPEQHLFVELTTLNQRLVTKKNAKVRRLRALYPDVRVKILYQRDTLSLLAKYGLGGDGVARRRTARSA